MSYPIQYKSESIDNLEQLVQEASPSVNRQIQSRIIKKIIWLAENFENITQLRIELNEIETMISDSLNRILPSTEELPCSDDIPVDNVGVSPSRSEDQNFLPNVLLFLLGSIWADRFDWYFGADMAIYHTTGKNLRVPVVPDGFLSLGVERQKGGKSRRSYAVWEENEIVPILTLEMVSQAPGGSPVLRVII